jgi:hypothetical protein
MRNIIILYQTSKKLLEREISKKLIPYFFKIYLK